MTEKKENGFTLMEFLIVLALLLVVLGLGYNLFFYTQKSFQDAEQRWIQQRDAKRVSDYISSIVKNSYYVDIIGDIDQTYTFDEDYSYIFLDSDGIIKYKNFSEPIVNLSSTNLMPKFGKARDSEGKDLYNVLSYDISTTMGNYELKSSVFLQNVKAILPLNSSEDSTETGSAIRFKNTESITDQPEINVDVGTFCFIATASYGSCEQQSVSLLRRFRDEVLLTNPAGKWFVDFYYEHSPALAKIIENSSILKLITRILLLPFIGLAAIAINKFFAVYALVYLAIMVSLLKYRDKKYKHLS